MKTNEEIMREHETDEGDEGYLGCEKYKPYSVRRMMEEAQYEVIKKIEDKLIPIETNDVTGFIGMKKEDFIAIKKEIEVERYNAMPQWGKEIVEKMSKIPPTSD